MTKTYSEMRQAAYFKAARDLRKVACSCWDDLINEVETGNMATLIWTKSNAKNTMDQAQRLEDLGHEQAIASALDETLLRKSKTAYSTALEACRERIRKYHGTELVSQLDAWRPLTYNAPVQP